MGRWPAKTPNIRSPGGVHRTFTGSPCFRSRTASAPARRTPARTPRPRQERVKMRGARARTPYRPRGRGRPRAASWKPPTHARSHPCTCRRSTRPRDPDGPDRGRSEVPPAAPGLRPGGYVLVVDDDRPMLRVLSTGLRAYGFPVVTAADAGSALDLAARRPPEAVLLDLRLPDLDGMEVLRSLRASGDVPVLVVSARAGVAARIEALDAGADDYVTKPFAIGELRPAPRGAAPAPAPGPRTGHPRPVSRRSRRVHDRPARTGCRGGRGAADPDRVAAARPAAAQPRRLVPGRHLLAEIWGPGTSDTPTTCGSTSPACAASSKPTRPTHAISSPNRDWATVSSPEP